MKMNRLFIVLVAVTLTGVCSGPNISKPGPEPGEPWLAVHILGYETDQELEELKEIIPLLADMGINTLVFEVDYNFDYKSHPELKRGENPITKTGAQEFVNLCHDHGIRVIPEFQCLGHQSWEEETFPLLTVYPQFDLTPGAFPNNENIYCREWDLMNPKVNSIIFELLDEIIDAFQADAFHVGMDEVFLLGNELSPSTKGMDPGELYAKAINDIYDHLVKEQGVEMLMWSDRLFDGKDHEFGEWESSLNGTASAVDKIPKDIIMCAWHYEKMTAYPSVPMFIEKGFRVLPTSWRDVEASRALILYSQSLKDPKILGHLFTTWGKTDLLKYEPLNKGVKLFSDRQK